MTPRGWRPFFPEIEPRARPRVRAYCDLCNVQPVSLLAHRGTRDHRRRLFAQEARIRGDRLARPSMISVSLSSEAMDEYYDALAVEIGSTL